MMDQRIEGIDEDDGVVELRPLVFEQISADEKTTVYRALVDNAKPPGRSEDGGETSGAGDIVSRTTRAVVESEESLGVPVYSVTVSVASARSEADAADLTTFLSQTRAQFLLDAPFPDVDGTEEPEDLSKELVIELGVQDPRGVRGSFGVVAILETTAEEEPPTDTGTPQALTLSASESVRANRDHKYVAEGGLKKATVTWRKGRGSVRKPPLDLSETLRVQSLRASTVWVHGKTVFTYRFVGRFNRES
jgi:hypothetical protein